MSPSDIAEVVREDGVAIRGTIQDRAYQAYMDHMAGENWDEIAKKHGYASVMSVQVEVRQYVQRAAVMMDEAKREEVLALELSRLDALQNAVWDMALMGSTKHVDAVLKVMGQRAKLLGLELLAQGVDSAQSKTVVVMGDTQEFIRSLSLVRGEIDA
jgi:hypothetical protein